MPGIVGVLILVLILLFLFWMTANVMGVILTLVVAAIVGWLADAIVPGNLPFGWIGAIIAGLVGTWLGTRIMGDVGPTLAGIPLISAFVGAVILSVIFAVVGRMASGRPA